MKGHFLALLVLCITLSNCAIKKDTHSKMQSNFTSLSTKRLYPLNAAPLEKVPIQQEILQKQHTDFLPNKSAVLNLSTNAPIEVLNSTNKAAFEHQYLQQKAAALTKKSLGKKSDLWTVVLVLLIL